MKINNMNRKLAIVISIASLVAMASPVFAETLIGKGIQADIQTERAEIKTQVEANRVEVKATMEANKAEVKEVREENKTELEAKRDALKTDVKAKRMELVSKFGPQMIKVHQAAVVRLETLANRIGSRITKIETERKVSLTDAKTKLADARVKIATAKTYIDGLQVQIDATVAAGTDPKATLETVRGFFKISRENLKSAHAALVDVISSLKPGDNKATSTATTTI